MDQCVGCGKKLVSMRIEELEEKTERYEKSLLYIQEQLKKGSQGTRSRVNQAVKDALS